MEAVRRAPGVWGLGLILAVAACVSSVEGIDPEPVAIGPVGLPMSWSAGQCAAVQEDVDRDGLEDRCELALAKAFAPVMITAEGGCNWDGEVSPARLRGAYLYAVQSVEDVYRIAYLPAYFRDCGWRGAKCWLPWVDCAPHAGDSEAIVVELVYGAQEDRWRTTGVFLSAHCFGRHGGGCRWYRGEGLEAFAWAEGRRYGAPEVWVAEGRHANYPSRQACDRGHFGLDTCDRNEAHYRFPVHSSGQDLGSRAWPIGGDGCLAAEALPAAGRGTVPGTVECFWRLERAFGGWQGEEAGSGATAYACYLMEVAGF